MILVVELLDMPDGLMKAISNAAMALANKIATIAEKNAQSGRHEQQ
jgi:hypothetical protein